MPANREPFQAFLVRVGHWETYLQARDAEEAVRLARVQMARELPRLYDVIHELTAARFQVEAAAQAIVDSC